MAIYVITFYFIDYVHLRNSGRVGITVSILNNNFSANINFMNCDLKHLMKGIVIT